MLRKMYSHDEKKYSTKAFKNVEKHTNICTLR